MSGNALTQEEPALGESPRSAPVPPSAAEKPKASIALDQWRGFAILLVLVSHGLFFTDLVNGVGRIGVNIFFFISGILVFRSLNTSLGTPWTVARGFWMRRLRRLYPALAVYVAVMLALTPLLQHLRNLPPYSDFSTYLRSLPWALFYGIDYFPMHARSLGHLWSLACEVQFYALAPIFFFLGGRSRARRVWVFGGLALAFCAYGLLHTVWAVNIEDGRYHFEVAAWPMMLGFFCESVKRWFLKIPLPVARLILVLGGMALGFSLVIMAFGIQMKVFVVAAGALLVWPCFISYLFGFALPGRAGEFVSWAGARSYSIYLWQQPLTICGYLPHMLQPLGSAASMVLGGISFRLFETPFLTRSRRKSLALG
jgi:peptidoglycan/LPS O-acetylase OafA/YrhL